MRAVAFVVAVAVCCAVSTVQGTDSSPNNQDLPAPTFSTPVVPYDSIRTWPQPPPTTNAQKSAVNFKPLLAIADNECWPHAAVTVDGKVSSGLPTAESNCLTFQGQIYGRADKIGSNWGTMYAWSFPTLNGTVFKDVVVWINDATPSDNQRIVSVSRHLSDIYMSQKPPSNVMTGNHAELIYKFGELSFNPERDGGEYLLIMWDQLTDAAKKSLNDANWPGGHVPFNDINFSSNLHNASQSLKKVTQWWG